MLHGKAMASRNRRVQEPVKAEWQFANSWGRESRIPLHFLSTAVYKVKTKAKELLWYIAKQIPGGPSARRGHEGGSTSPPRTWG